MKDEVNELLATAWAADAAKDKKVLEYVLLSMKQELPHILEHSECKQELWLIMKTMYLLERLLNAPPDRLEQIEDVLKRAFGFTELQAARRVYETLHK